MRSIENFIKNSPVFNRVSSFDEYKHNGYFLSNGSNIARTDKLPSKEYYDLYRLIEAYDWRFSDANITKDISDVSKLNDIEYHYFISNFTYQTVMDSEQGENPITSLINLVSHYDLKRYLVRWASNENLHSSVYEQFINIVLDDPSVIYEGLVTEDFIVKRTNTIEKYFKETAYYNAQWMIDGLQWDDKMKYDAHKAIIRTLASINFLEGIRFYQSFACTFSFGERNTPILEGLRTLLEFIARDENVHLLGTQALLDRYKNRKEGDLAYEAWLDSKEDVIQIGYDVVSEEKDWSDHLTSKGEMNMITNVELKNYVDYISDQRMLYFFNANEFNYSGKPNPFKWMSKYLDRANVQNALQEKNGAEYVVDLDNDINLESLKLWV